MARKLKGEDKMWNEQLRKIAASDGIILITGRTGSGKSYLAKEIHDASPRREKKFLAINLATLSENLIESELFGHERGAFSGAEAKRIGKLEIANGGTIFLDEIGELPIHLQTKLLEALNSKSICPVGSNRDIQLDIRILAATNRDLESMVRAGTFREDLFYRLNLFRIELPGLSGDSKRLLSLARAFAAEACRRQGREYHGLSTHIEEALIAYPWPGNIRELKNAMEFAVAMSNGGMLGPDLLPPYMRSGGLSLNTSEAVSFHFPAIYQEAKSQFERLFLQEALRRYEGKVNLTSRKTGLSKVTLIEKIRRYEIDVHGIKYRAQCARKELA
jgi:transcriptional regulator with PAS, ATPase and Fis domain